MIGDRNKRILFLSEFFDGGVHDFKIFKLIFTNFDFTHLKVAVDLGFLGIKKVIKYEDLFIPIKSSKNCPLTQEQKNKNSILSSSRVVIEHTIARIKSFFILRIENRMRIPQKLNDAMLICSQIANYKLKY